MKVHCVFLCVMGSVSTRKLRKTPTICWAKTFSMQLQKKATCPCANYFCRPPNPPPPPDGDVFRAIADCFKNGDPFRIAIERERMNVAVWFVANGFFHKKDKTFNLEYADQVFDVNLHGRSQIRRYRAFINLMKQTIIEIVSLCKIHNETHPSADSNPMCMVWRNPDLIKIVCDFAGCSVDPKNSLGKLNDFVSYVGKIARQPRVGMSTKVFHSRPSKYVSGSSPCYPSSHPPNQGEWQLKRRKICHCYNIGRDFLSIVPDKIVNSGVKR